MSTTRANIRDLRDLVTAFGMGNGHATRVQPCIDALLADAHEVMVGASGQAFSQLQSYFESRPEVRVVEFMDPIEAVSCALARKLKLLLVTLDNYQALVLCELPEDAKKDRLRFHVWKAIIRYRTRGMARAILPSLDLNLEVNAAYRDRVVMTPPIVREAFTGLRKPGEHLLVYVSRMQDKAPLIEALKKSGQPCIIYDKDADGEEKLEGKLLFKPFNPDAIAQDMATAKGVIMTAGMSAISESCYLGVPMLLLPLKKHVEQWVNACVVAAAGYAMVASKPTEEVIQEFLGKLPEFEEALGAYPRDNRSGMDAFREVMVWAEERVGREG